MTKDGHIGIAKNAKNPINPIAQNWMEEVGPNTYNAVATPIKIQSSQSGKTKVETGKPESEGIRGYQIDYHYQNNGELFGKQGGVAKPQQLGFASEGP